MLRNFRARRGLVGMLGGAPIAQALRGVVSPLPAASSRTAADLKPRFEISEVHDDPSKGYLLRVSLDEKRVTMTYYPQLGQRKTDPMDPSPQFDFAARRSVRLFQHEVAGVLTVCENMTSEHHFGGNQQDLTFSKTGNYGYVLQGTTGRKLVASPISMRFDGYQAIMLRDFLRSALVESFGFRRHFKFLNDKAAAASPAAPSGSDEQAAFQRNRAQQPRRNYYRQQQQQQQQQAPSAPKS